jgi:hypothetical protein
MIWDTQLGVPAAIGGEELSGLYLKPFTVKLDKEATSQRATSKNLLVAEVSNLSLALEAPCLARLNLLNFVTFP